jgi:hypothetical protein
MAGAFAGLSGRGNGRLDKRPTRDKHLDAHMIPIILIMVQQMVDAADATRRANARLAYRMNQFHFQDLVHRSR